MVFIEDMLIAAFGNQIFMFKKELNNQTKLP